MQSTPAQHFDGSAGIQSPNPGAASTALFTHSATLSAAPPAAVRVRVLLNAKQAAERFCVSERTFHKMRAEDWMPLPVEPRPGMPRWVAAELDEAILKRMPRKTAASEPAQLSRSRQQRRDEVPA